MNGVLIRMFRWHMLVMLEKMRSGLRLLTKGGIMCISAKYVYLRGLHREDEVYFSNKVVHHRYFDLNDSLK